MQNCPYFYPVRFILIFLFLLTTSEVFAQRDNYWVFGDSCGINFTTNPPTVDTTRIIMSEEPAASISDLNGNLLFYVGTPSSIQTSNLSKKYVVRNAMDSVMAGGDSLNGHTSVTQGILILPNPANAFLYYIFHIGLGVLSYSEVDMSLNGGYGEVTSSNNFLLGNVSEKLHAVKAANGIDWWVIGTVGSFSGSFYQYKVDSIGIHFKGLQLPLNIFSFSVGQIIFSQDGSNIISAGGDSSYILTYDRCLGYIGNQTFIDSKSNVNYNRYGASFSPSGRYAYLSSFDSLWQFDINASNIAASKQLIFTIDTGIGTPIFIMGQHMLAPDGKIYIANAYISASVYPPSDSLNTHLSIINYPDSSGLSCNFSPYNFQLNKRKSLGSLPNMVNYNLGPLEGVNCDSILAASVLEKENSDFSIFPNPATSTITIRFKNKLSDGTSVALHTLDGKLVQQQWMEGNAKELHFNLNPSVKPGIYFIKVTNREHYSTVKKIVITN